MTSAQYLIFVNKSTEYSRRYRAKHTAKVKARRRAHYLANKERLGAQTKQNWRERRGRDPIGVLLAAARQRARRKGVLFSICREDIRLPALCPVLGIALELAWGGRKDNSPSLDRIDNRKGYIPGNMAVISWRANRIKSDANAEELQKVASYAARAGSHQ